MQVVGECLGDDRAGVVELVTDGWHPDTAGLLMRVAFEPPLARAPRMLILTAENRAAQALDFRKGAYASQATATGFGVYAGEIGVEPDTCYLWRYTAIGCAA